MDVFRSTELSQLHISQLGVVLKRTQGKWRVETDFASVLAGVSQCEQWDQKSLLFFAVHPWQRHCQDGAQKGTHKPPDKKLFAVHVLGGGLVRGYCTAFWA